MLEILEASPEQPAQQLRPHILPTSGPVRATAVPQLRHPEPEPLTGFFKREQPSKPVKTASALGHRSIALSVAVDADARRISQALTEPEYLEAWISLPDHAEDSQIVASKERMATASTKSAPAAPSPVLSVHSSFVISARCGCRGAT